MQNIEKMMKDLDLSKYDCDLVDIRFEKTISTQILFVNGELIQAVENPSTGFFIRVFKNGQWFYEASTHMHGIGEQIEKLVKFADQFKEEKSTFHGLKNNGIHHLLKYESKRFDKISMEEKINLVKKYVGLKDKINFVNESRVRYSDVYRLKYYKSSVGTEFVYDFNQAGLAFNAVLKDGDQLFTDYIMEYTHDFSGLDNLESKILNHFEEAEKFLHAKTVEQGKYRVVLSPEIVGIFTHESFGHKSEADFMLGDLEALKEWELGKTVGSPLLSIVDSGLHESTSGYCPIDDEGTLAQKNYLIKDGKLTGRLHSKHTADELNELPTGNCRAIGFEWEPIVRMTSTYIEPGKQTFDEILKLAGNNALYIDGAKHGTGGSTFTIAPTRAYKIVDGKLTEPLKVSLISGSVFETLNHIEAVGNDFELVSSAFGGCGKMSQWPLSVSDGGPSILVNGMQVS